MDKQTALDLLTNIDRFMLSTSKHAKRVLEVIKSTTDKLDPISKKIISEGFIESRYSNNELANELGYSTRHIRRLKNKALIEFADKWDT